MPKFGPKAKALFRRVYKIKKAEKNLLAAHTHQAQLSAALDFGKGHSHALTISTVILS